MDDEIIGKLDAPLLALYTDYLNNQPGKTSTSDSEEKEASQSSTFNLALRYQNDLSEIESLGFETSWSAIPGFANGYLHLDDLDKIASHPNVLSLSLGTEPDILLDTSVKDIEVRSNTTGNIGTNGLWHVDSNNGAITSLPGGLSGAGIILGIIDTGIDIEHPVFNTGIFPTLSSRILSVWDQGLTPQGGEAGPNASLLTVSQTYGVEFERTQIENLINGSIDKRTKDCVGHGTHVAATAAGNGSPGEPIIGPRANFNFVGVAPKADIISVKLIDVPTPVKDADKNTVSYATRFRDAFMYILNKAGSTPVVINCSFGSPLGPHDGLTDDEQFLNALFAPGSPYYNGKMVVYAAGNTGSVRQHAQVTIPASGEIIVPFTLFDTRAFKKKFKECKWQDGTRHLFVDMWYREVTAPADVAVQVKAPTEATFSGSVFSGSLTRQYDGGKRRTLHHKAIAAVQRPDGSGGTVSVQRNNAYLLVEPNSRTDPAQHSLGRYEIKILGPAGTVVHAWTSLAGRRLGFRVGTHTTLTQNAASGDTNLTVHDSTGFNVGDTVEISLDSNSLHTATISTITPGGTPDTDVIQLSVGLPSPATSGNTIIGVLDPAIVVNNKFQIGPDGGAKNVITVAAYDDNDGNTGSPPHRQITSFSSRGPLVDYSGLGPVSDKPDIAAPGFKIRAALSKDEEGGVGLSFDEVFGNRFKDKSGTSMAAPHIAGLVALLLQKENSLNVDQVKAIFSNSVNNLNGTGPTPAQTPTYQEAYGGGIASGKKSADATP